MLQINTFEKYTDGFSLLIRSPAQMLGLGRWCSSQSWFKSLMLMVVYMKRL